MSQVRILPGILDASAFTVKPSRLSSCKCDAHRAGTYPCSSGDRASGYEPEGRGFDSLHGYVENRVARIILSMNGTLSVKVMQSARIVFLGRLMAGRLALNQVTVVRPHPREQGTQ